MSMNRRASAPGSTAAVTPRRTACAATAAAPSAQSTTVPCVRPARRLATSSASSPGKAPTTMFTLPAWAAFAHARTGDGSHSAPAAHPAATRAAMMGSNAPDPAHTNHLAAVASISARSSHLAAHNRTRVYCRTSSDVSPAPSPSTASVAGSTPPPS